MQPFVCHGLHQVHNQSPKPVVPILIPRSGFFALLSAFHSPQFEEEVVRCLVDITAAAITPTSHYGSCCDQVELHLAPQMSTRPSVWIPDPASIWTRPLFETQPLKKNSCTRPWLLYTDMYSIYVLRPSGSAPNWSLGEGINSMNTHTRQSYICACIEYDVRIISRCTCT